MHAQVVSFLKKQVFLKLTIFFISTAGDIYRNLLAFSESLNENKGVFNSNIFRDSAYVSTYLQTKTFVCKRDCAIFSKLQMLWCLPKSF